MNNKQIQNKRRHLVSIVVPVYKVENYIRECIDSILSQKYKFFELILVDDGSPDNCGKICDEYASIDRRIRVIHKENGGLSDARNAGINIATGDYITFIDSDDYVSMHYVSEMIAAAETTHADIVQGQMTRIAESLDEDCFIGEKIYDGKEAFKQLLTWNEIKVYAWGKLYKRKIFDSIRYPLGKLNEDCFTTYKTLLLSSKVVSIGKCLYYYRQTPNSILNRDFSYRRFDLWEAVYNIENYLMTSHCDCKEEFEYYKMRVGINLINESAHSKNRLIVKKRNEIIKEIRTTNNKNPYLNIKYKGLLLLLKGSPLVYLLIIPQIRSYRRSK